jgi:AMIN domain
MKSFCKLIGAGALLLIGFYPVIAKSQVPAALEQITVLGTEQAIGVRITASRPVVTESQVLSGPDRLILDFPGAVPGKDLRGLRLNYGKIKAVRAALWRSNPPVTRVVIDLDGSASYRLVSTGKSITVRLGVSPTLMPSNAVSRPVLGPQPAPKKLANSTKPVLQVRFDRGLLTISTTGATLADVLYEIHLATGADIPIPSGAEEERVAIQAGPGPAKDVIAALLNGSGFNYVLQGTAQDPQSVATLLLTRKDNVGPESSMPPRPQTSIGKEQEQPAAPIFPASPPMEPVQELGPNPELTPNPVPADDQ